MYMQVIFIAGASYSGTTALDVMLSSYDGVFSAGEMIALHLPIRSNHLRVLNIVDHTHESSW